MLINPPAKQYDCFDSCFSINLNDASTQFVSNQALKQQSKRQKLSLKRRPNCNYLTERDSIPYNKKIWQERTRTGTDRIQKYSIPTKRNPVSLRSTNIPKDSPILRNNMILSNQSTRTFQIPPSNPQNMHIPMINISHSISNIPYKYHPKNQSLTERTSSNNIRSQPLFLRQELENKVAKSMIPQIKPTTQYSGQSKKQRNDFQNQYETVNSVFSNSIIEERISQSTIQIDFFHPSDTRLFNIDLQGIKLK